MNNEKISFLIPVYNRIKFLPRLINCIFKQTYSNWQAIFVVDGGNDGSLEYLINIANRHNKIIVYYWYDNKGISFARNKLLEVCDTKYAVWQDSDDYCSYRRLEEQLKIMGEEDKIVYSCWDKSKNYIMNDETLSKAIDFNNPSLGFAPTMFPVNKSIKFNEKLLFGNEDHTWLAEMRKIYPEVWCNKLLYWIDFHGDRIGALKRKICKDWGGKYTNEEIANLSYEEAIAKWKKETNG